jgi:hypothetical protein
MMILTGVVTMERESAQTIQEAAWDINEVRDKLEHGDLDVEDDGVDIILDEVEDVLYDMSLILQETASLEEFGGGVDDE